MSNKEKSIRIIECYEKKTDWDSWSKKFFLHGKWKGYKKLLVSTSTTPGVDKIPTQRDLRMHLREMMILTKRLWS